jgi:hypothetical protein
MLAYSKDPTVIRLELVVSKRLGSVFLKEILEPTSARQARVRVVPGGRTRLAGMEMPGAAFR